MVSKGKVSTIHQGGKIVTVTPYAGGIVTAELVVPWHLSGALSVGDPVVYVMFNDNTGIIIEREDGTLGSFGPDGDAYAYIENGILHVVSDCGMSASVEDGALVALSNGYGSAEVKDGALVVTFDSTGGRIISFSIDDTLKMSPSGILSVNTADAVEKDNTRPVTSAAVHTTVGNIEALLKLI